MTPHVVNAIQAPNEPTRIQPTPPRGTIDIGAHAAQRRFARACCARRTSPAGTATNVFGHFEIPVAGKTGTAQRAGEPDYALFASYAPVPNPKLVTVVVIERGGHGGVAGALTALDFYSKVFKVPEAEPRHRRGQVDLMSSVLIPGERVRARELPPHAPRRACSAACAGSTG